MVACAPEGTTKSGQGQTDCPHWGHGAPDAGQTSAGFASGWQVRPAAVMPVVAHSSVGFALYVDSIVERHEHSAP